MFVAAVLSYKMLEIKGIDNPMQRIIAIVVVLFLAFV